MQPYLKSRQILICPSNTAPVSPVSTTAGNDIVLSYAYMSYAYNEYVSGFGPKKLSAFENPTQCPSLFDAVGTTSTDWALTSYVYITSNNGRWFGRKVINTNDQGNSGSAIAGELGGLPYANLHLEGSNYLFVDGHVKFFRGIGTPASPAFQNATVPSVIQPNVAPPMNGLDWNCDGIVGNNAGANPSTSGKYD